MDLIFRQEFRYIRGIFVKIFSGCLDVRIVIFFIYKKIVFVVKLKIIKLLSDK